ncbi:uncharacterized protein [Centruroides vittatus]|uniref:uncharacterized protein n=1 Tax=Centruroides vittatus TaxID=120091 RepID=UPI003510CA63
MFVIYILFLVFENILCNDISNENGRLVKSESVSDGAGRTIQVSAKDYVEKYKEKLDLGDCPVRELTFSNGTTRIIPCPFKYTGDVHFIPLARTNLDIRRVQKAEDVLSRVGGGLGIGAGIMGLAKVSIKVKAAVDTQNNKKQMSLSSNYVIQRGVLSLRNARPVGDVDPDFVTQLYLSEVVIGGEETLLVTMEFESERKKTEVETSVTVKILFISITAKMRFISENFHSAAAVKVSRVSSWRRTETRTFLGPGSLKSALKVIEEYENKFKVAPQELQQLPLEDSSLHIEYHFNTWKTPTQELNFNEAQVNSYLEVLKRQILELETVVKRVRSYINYVNRVGAVTISKRKELEKFEIEMKEKAENLQDAYNGYFLMSVEERKNIVDIYGRKRAPFYYMRKLGSIFQPGEDYTYLEEIQP